MTSTEAFTMNGSLLVENNSELLISRYTEAELYENFNPAIYIVDKYVTPVWYVVGFPGNIISFLVWIQRRLHHSSGCYLAALAMADFLFLVLQLLFELQNTWNVRVLEINVICQLFPILFYTTQYLSPLLVMGFTVERYISICHPFKRDQFCTGARAVKVIIGLVVLSISLHVVQGYFWIYDTDKGQCMPRPSVLEGGEASPWSVWSWISELLVFGLVPLATLILNILVIKEAKKLSDNEEKMLCLKKGSKSSSPSATTFMLLAVSFYLIFTTLPVTISYAMYLSFPPGSWNITEEQFRADPIWQSYMNFHMSRMIIQELCMSHYACNIFIYIFTGKQFRIEMLRLICKKKLKPKWEDDFHHVSTKRAVVDNETTNGSPSVSQV